MGARPVVLFGYDSSTFTKKIRFVLRCKQIPYTFVAVPSMMPRPLLKDNFHLTYRKIPVLAIGRDLYCDTSIITEALEHFFSDGYPSIYPPSKDGRTNKTLMRGFASYWTDRPFFRITTGLMPGSIWRSSFGQDRAGLIGHKLDPDKLEAKIPRNLVNFDLQCSLFEAQFKEIQAAGGSPWLYPTDIPSLADVSLYYAYCWGNDISKGIGYGDLTAGGVDDTKTEGTDRVFNSERHPALLKWFNQMGEYIESLPVLETRVSGEEGIEILKRCDEPPSTPRLLPTPTESHGVLDPKIGLKKGTEVTIAPDDTGRDDPTIGTLLALSPEEVVIKPVELESAPTVQMHIHFPRLGFVVRPHKESRI